MYLYKSRIYKRVYDVFQNVGKKSIPMITIISQKCIITKNTYKKFTKRYPNTCFGQVFERYYQMTIIKHPLLPIFKVFIKKTSR